jgi:2,5-furandicarboxylate decarboxylase 1
MISNSEVLDTNFRSAIDRMINQGRIEAFTSPIDTNLAVAGVMKKRDGGPALLFYHG